MPKLNVSFYMTTFSTSLYIAHPFFPIFFRNCCFYFFIMELVYILTLVYILKELCVEAYHNLLVPHHTS